jgi:hypothetical protein
MNVTAEELVQQILEIDNTPLNQATFSEEQIIKYMDQELHSVVVPITKSCLEEFFINVMTIDSMGELRYLTIPPDAAGFALRDIYIYDFQDNFRAKCNRINPDQIPYLTANLYTFNLNSSYSGIQYYYIENNNIVFWPSINVPCRIKVRYFKSPNHLMNSIQAGGRITGKAALNMLQLDNVPNDWTIFTGVNAITLDVTTPESPFNFRTYIQSVPTAGNAIGTPGIPITNTPLISVSPGFTIEVDQATYDSVQVGDYVWRSGYCGFVQYLPFESYELIKVRASMRILKAQGDLQNLQVSAQLFNALADDYKQLISPKVQNAPKKITMGARLTDRTFGRFGGRF